MSSSNERYVWLKRYVPLLLWIGVIFFLSSSQGASGRTSLIIRPLLEFLFPSATEESLIFYHGLIRKFAHFTEYAVLGFLACRAFRTVTRLYILTAFGLVFLIATMDEFNQSFNPLRTSSPWDVVIDVFGGSAAIAVSWIWTRKRDVN